MQRQFSLYLALMLATVIALLTAGNVLGTALLTFVAGPSHPNFMYMRAATILSTAFAGCSFFVYGRTFGEAYKNPDVRPQLYESSFNHQTFWSLLSFAQLWIVIIIA